jgi:hypothetical protein
MSREFIAKARAHSRMDDCAMTAFGDHVGSLLIWWIDLGDKQARRQAKWILSGDAAQRNRVSILISNSSTHNVLDFMREQRCLGCHGRQMRISDSGVYTACLDCNATGLLRDPPTHWGKVHHSVLRDCQAHIGRLLGHVANERRELD